MKKTIQSNYFIKQQNSRSTSWYWLKAVFGLVLMIALGYQLRHRLVGLNLSDISVTALGTAIVFVVVILAGLNWSLEAFKWKAVLKNTSISFRSAMETVLVGLSFAIFTPGRVGDYVGRAIQSPASLRSRSVLSTFICSLAQLSVTLGFGLLSLVVFINSADTHLVKISPFWLAIPLVVGICIYFNIEKVIQSFERFRWFDRFQFNMTNSSDTNQKANILALSAGRYAVYVLQSVLLLQAFELNIPMKEAILGVSIMFLVQTLIPMPMLFQVATKIELALLLWSPFDPSVAALSLVILVLWVINVVIPGLAGYGMLNFNTLTTSQKNSI